TSKPQPHVLYSALIALYWIGFIRLARFFAYRHGTIALLVTALPFLPFLINFCGMIWKDVLLFVCLLNATPFVLERQQPQSHQNLPYYRSTISAGIFILLIIVGAMSRHNSIFAPMPLFVGYFWPAVGHFASPRWVFGRLLVGSLVFGILVITVSKAMDRFVFHSRDVKIENTLFLFDLDGISKFPNRNDLPWPLTGGESEQIVQHCYDTKQVNSLDEGECEFILTRLKKDRFWWGQGKFSEWIN